MSDSDSILGHRDYFTDVSPRTITLKSGREVRRLKRFNRDSDPFLGPQKLIRAESSRVNASSISQGSLPDAVDGHVPKPNTKRVQNVDITSSHKPAFAHTAPSNGYSDVRKEHTLSASKHQNKRDDSVLGNHAAKCTVTAPLALPTYPKSTTNHTVKNPFYLPNPTLPTVKNCNHILTEEEEPPCHDPYKSCHVAKDLKVGLIIADSKTMSHNCKQPVATIEPDVLVSRKMSKTATATGSFVKSYSDEKGLQEKCTKPRPKQAVLVQERKNQAKTKSKESDKLDCCLESKHNCLPVRRKKGLAKRQKFKQKTTQCGVLDWLEEYEESLPGLTESSKVDWLKEFEHTHTQKSKQEGKKPKQSKKLDWLQDLEANFPIKLEKHVSSGELKQTVQFNLDWLKEFEVGPEHQPQEPTHNVKVPDMSVPGTSSPSGNFNAAINDNNAATHDIAHLASQSSLNAPHQAIPANKDPGNVPDMSDTSQRQEVPQNTSLLGDGQTSGEHVISNTNRPDTPSQTSIYFDAIDDSLQIDDEENSVVTLSNMPGLQKLFTNVRQSSASPADGKRTSVNVQFHESLGTAIMDVTGDGSNPEKVLHMAAQQLQSILDAVIDQNVSCNEDEQQSETQVKEIDNGVVVPTSLVSQQESGCRGAVPEGCVAPEQNIMDDDKMLAVSDLSEGDSPPSDSKSLEVPRYSEDINEPSDGYDTNSECDSDLGVNLSKVYLTRIGDEISRTVSGYLSDASTINRDSLDACMARLDVTKLSLSSIKQEPLTEDYGSLHSWTRNSLNVMLPSWAFLKQETLTEDDEDPVQPRTSSDVEENGETVTTPQEQQAKEMGCDVDVVSNAFHVKPNEEEVQSQTSSISLRLSISESDTETFIGSPELLERSLNRQETSVEVSMEVDLDLGLNNDHNDLGGNVADVDSLNDSSETNVNLSQPRPIECSQNIQQALGSRSEVVNEDLSKSGQDLDNSDDAQSDKQIESSSNVETNITRAVQRSKNKQQASGSRSEVVNESLNKSGQDLDNSDDTLSNLQIESSSDSETNITRPVQRSTNRLQASSSRLEVGEKVCNQRRRPNAASARRFRRIMEPDSDSDSDAGVPNETFQRTEAQKNRDGRHGVVKITHPASRGARYSEAERRNIVAYIVECSAYKLLKGKAFWQKMESKRVCPGRTWQSLKEHFHKAIVNNIRNYVTAAELLKFAQGYQGCRRRQEVMDHRSHYYSEKEKQMLVTYMLKCQRYQHVGGNNVWKRLEDKKILPGRTWQSMRNHYRKVLIHNLRGLDISQSEAAALRTYCPPPTNTT